MDDVATVYCTNVASSKSLTNALAGQVTVFLKDFLWLSLMIWQNPRSTLVENNQKMSHFSKTRQIGHFLAFSMNFCLNCKRSSLRSQCCKMRLFLRFFKHRVKTEIFRKFCSRTIVYSLLVPPLLLWLDHLSRQMARFWIFPPFDKATAHSRSFIIPITFNHGIRTSIVWFNWVFPILLPNYLSLIMI